MGSELPGRYSLVQLKGGCRMLLSISRLLTCVIFVSTVVVSNAGWAGEKVLLDTYVVYLDNRAVLRIVDRPGALTSTALPPPGAQPVRHPFLTASALDSAEEGRLSEILSTSKNTLEFLDHLRQAGYGVRREENKKQFSPDQ